MRPGDHPDRSLDSTFSQQRLDSTSKHHAARTPKPAAMDLDKLYKIVDAIMRWPDKAAECCRRGKLFARRFKLLEELGRGGFGVVYRATDNKSRPTKRNNDPEPIALKILCFPPDEETQGVRTVSPEKRDWIGRMLKEIDRQDDVTKIPGCVPMKYCDAPSGTDDLDALLEFVKKGPIWFSMPVYPRSLAKYLEEKEGKLPIDEAVHIMVGVARALQSLHSFGASGIIHRDLKPSNILLTHDNKPVVSDYGLSVGGFDQRVTGNTISGTWVYMSPEQIEGRATTAKSDIWSWGVILYQLISGKLPFGGPHMRERINTGTFPSLSQCEPSCPEYLVNIVDRCLRKKNALEFESFQTVLAALEDGQRNRADSARVFPCTIDTFSKHCVIHRAQQCVDAMDLGLAAHLLDFMTNLTDNIDGRHLVAAFYAKFFPGVFRSRAMGDPPPSLSLEPYNESTVIGASQHYRNQLRTPLHQEFYSVGNMIGRLAIIEGGIAIHGFNELSEREQLELDYIARNVRSVLTQYEMEGLYEQWFPTIRFDNRGLSVIGSTKHFLPRIRGGIRRVFATLLNARTSSAYNPMTELLTRVFRLGVEAAFFDLAFEPTIIESFPDTADLANLEFIVKTASDIGLRPHDDSAFVAGCQAWYRKQFPDNPLFDFFEIGTSTARAIAGESVAYGASNLPKDFIERRENARSNLHRQLLEYELADVFDCHFPNGEATVRPNLFASLVDLFIPKLAGAIIRMTF